MLRRPRSSSSTPAPSSTRPSRSPSTPSSRWRSTRRLAGRGRLIVAGCLVERYRDEIRKNIPEVDAVVGTGELEQILSAAGLDAPRPAIQEPSPFTILTAEQANDRKAGPSTALPAVATLGMTTGLGARPEGDLRESQGRFARNGLGWR